MSADRMRLWAYSQPWRQCELDPNASAIKSKERQRWASTVSEARPLGARGAESENLAQRAFEKTVKKRQGGRRRRRHLYMRLERKSKSEARRLRPKHTAGPGGVEGQGSALATCLPFPQPGTPSRAGQAVQAKYSPGPLCNFLNKK